MMGPGMMGMMMGMMSIRVDRPAINARRAELDITNWSRSLVHEVLIVPVDSPDAPLPMTMVPAKWSRIRSTFWPTARS